MARRHHPDHVPSAADRALAGALGPAAWVHAGDGVLAARAAGRASPLRALCRAVWADRPTLAHATLRGRLFTNAPGRGDADVVKLCGRRWSVVAPGSDDAAPPVRWLAPAPAAPLLALDAAPRSLCGWAAVARARSGPPGGARDDRPVVALLVGPDGALLAAAHNRAGRSRADHAELVLLDGFPAEPPAGSTVLVTLQCCRMCAALLDAAWPSVAVRFLDPDPGRFARGTALAAREVRLPG